MLERYFGEGKAKHVVLIDEAHNLVDRSREMYSASLTIAQFEIEDASSGKGASEARRALSNTRKEFAKLLKSSATGVPPSKSYHQGAFASETLPEVLLESLRTATTAIERRLVEETNRESALPWLEVYFALNSFLLTGEAFDATYRTIIDPGNQQVTLFCVDPSKRLAQTLITRDNQKIDLTAREFSLLELFMQNQRRVLTRTIISEKIWESQNDLDANLIDGYMRRLRKKIEASAEAPIFKTLRGVSIQWSAGRWKIPRAACAS